MGSNELKAQGSKRPIAWAMAAGWPALMKRASMRAQVAGPTSFESDSPAGIIAIFWTFASEAWVASISAKKASLASNAVTTDLGSVMTRLSGRCTVP